MLFSFPQIVNSLSTFATIAILSMDLGHEYSWLESAVYTNILVQTIFVIAISYSQTDNIFVSGIITTLWFLLKYIPKLLKRTSIE